MDTYVYTAQGIREMDAELERLDLLELTMEHAGAASARRVHARFAGAKVLALAGSGANGGDALSAARHLLALGHEVRVLALESTHALTARMRGRLGGLVEVELLTPRALQAGLKQADLALDGLLGTGFRPPLRGDLPALAAQLNAWEGKVVSLDLPSGLSSDTVEPGEAFVRPHLTLALVGFKPALLFHDLGAVEVLDLGVPPALLARYARARLITLGQVRLLLPRRERGAHKGTAGRVYVLGGQPGYGGAPSMTALAALRTGSGLVSLYSRAELPHHPPEAMAHRLEDWEALNELARPDAVAVGMGLREDGQKVARAALGWGVPAVLDADALQPGLQGEGHDSVVWTPHPGEAARLLEGQTHDVTGDPLSAAQELQRRFGGVVVLKGGPSVIAAPTGLWVCPWGNPGMATGGSGDVLSGVIAALLGQGLSAQAAALAGVSLHALAGDLAYRTLGYGLIATDIAGALAPTWRALMEPSAPIAHMEHFLTERGSLIL